MNHSHLWVRLLEDTILSLPVGATAKIKHVVTTPSAYVKRLLALGLVPGTVLKVNRKAPLGDPVEIEIIGQRSLLTLRKHEAAILQVDKVVN